MLLPVHQSHTPIVQHYTYCFSVTHWIIDVFLSSLSALGAPLEYCCALFNILYTLALLHHSLRSPTVNFVPVFGAQDNEDWWKSSGSHCCLLFDCFAWLCIIWQCCVGDASVRRAAVCSSTHHMSNFCTFIKDIIPTHHLHVHGIKYIKSFCKAFYLICNIWIRLSQCV